MGTKQGFDERLTQRKLYGRGVYFTSDACKAAKYCGMGGGCLIVARVLLGQAFFADRPMPDLERPPEIQGQGVPHDSVVAQPGVPRKRIIPKGGWSTQTHQGGTARQAHWEFVVPRGDLQTYPE